ncbi:50S ribosomal protein L17 [Candidatus Azambacteria bacterium]|nr:50S ribosomal protein L17 [Candidatus Azambacteria bacterium]
MRNLRKGRKFNREAGQRKAFVKSLITAFITNGKIKTTEARAKEIKPKIEKMVTRGKVKTVANVREIRRVLSEDLTKKLFDEISPKYEKRAGGYTRITKLERRRSDGAKLAKIEFV